MSCETRLRVLLGRVVDEDVQPAQLPDRPADRLATEGLPAYVSGDSNCAHTALLREANRLPCVTVLVQIDDRHVGAFLGKGNGHGPSDATVAARDERDLASQFPRASRQRAVGLRARRHAGLQPRLAALALGGSQGSLGRRLLGHT